MADKERSKFLSNGEGQITEILGTIPTSIKWRKGFTKVKYIVNMYIIFTFTNIF